MSRRRGDVVVIEAAFHRLTCTRMAEGDAGTAGTSPRERRMRYTALLKVSTKLARPWHAGALPSVGTYVWMLETKKRTQEPKKWLCARVASEEEARDEVKRDLEKVRKRSPTKCFVLVMLFDARNSVSAAQPELCLPFAEHYDQLSSLALLHPEERAKQVLLKEIRDCKADYDEDDESNSGAEDEEDDGDEGEHTVSKTPEHAGRVQNHVEDECRGGDEVQSVAEHEGECGKRANGGQRETAADTAAANDQGSGVNSGQDGANGGEGEPQGKRRKRAMTRASVRSAQAKTAEKAAKTTRKSRARKSGEGAAGGRADCTGQAARGNEAANEEEDSVADDANSSQVAEGTAVYENSLLNGVRLHHFAESRIVDDDSGRQTAVSMDGGSDPGTPEVVSAGGKRRRKGTTRTRSKRVLPERQEAGGRAKKGDESVEKAQATSRSSRRKPRRGTPAEAVEDERRQPDDDEGSVDNPEHDAGKIDAESTEAVGNSQIEGEAVATDEDVANAAAGGKAEADQSPPVQAPLSAEAIEADFQAFTAGPPPIAEYMRVYRDVDENGEDNVPFYPSILRVARAARYFGLMAAVCVFPYVFLDPAFISRGDGSTSGVKEESKSAVKGSNEATVSDQAAGKVGGESAADGSAGQEASEVSADGRAAARKSGQDGAAETTLEEAPSSQNGSVPPSTISKDEATSNKEDTSEKTEEGASSGGDAKSVGQVGGGSEAVEPAGTVANEGAVDGNIRGEFDVPGSGVESSEASKSESAVPSDETAGGSAQHAAMSIDELRRSFAPVCDLMVPTYAFMTETELSMLADYSARIRDVSSLQLVNAAKLAMDRHMLQFVEAAVIDICDELLEMANVRLFVDVVRRMPSIACYMAIIAECREARLVEQVKHDGLTRDDVCMGTATAWEMMADRITQVSAKARNLFFTSEDLEDPIVQRMVDEDKFPGIRLDETDVVRAFLYHVEVDPSFAVLVESTFPLMKFFESVRQRVFRNDIVLGHVKIEGPLPPEVIVSPPVPLRACGGDVLHTLVAAALTEVEQRTRKVTSSSNGSHRVRRSRVLHSLARNGPCVTAEMCTKRLEQWAKNGMLDVNVATTTTYVEALRTSLIQQLSSQGAEASTVSGDSACESVLDKAPEAPPPKTEYQEGQGGGKSSADE